MQMHQLQMEEQGQPSPACQRQWAAAKQRLLRACQGQLPCIRSASARSLALHMPSRSGLLPSIRHAAFNLALVPCQAEQSFQAQLLSL